MKMTTSHTHSYLSERDTQSMDDSQRIENGDWRVLRLKLYTYSLPKKKHKILDISHCLWVGSILSIVLFFWLMLADNMHFLPEVHIYLFLNWVATSSKLKYSLLEGKGRL
ncbi:rCG63348, partial [Rattus norvegicus]